MEYKNNGIEEVPSLLDFLDLEIGEFTENLGRVNDYQNYPVEDFISIMFKNMDLELAYKTMDLINFDFLQLSEINLNERLWWFLKGLFWCEDETRLLNILKSRSAEIEKKDIIELVEATDKTTNKKRI